MTSFSEKFVAMTVATLKADKKALKEEFDTIKFLAEGLELDSAEVERLIQQEMQKDSDVIELAKTITDEKEKNLIIECCSIVALADKNLDEKEVELILSIAKAMGISEAKVVLTLAAVAQNDREIKISGNEVEDTQDEIIVED